MLISVLHFTTFFLSCRQSITKICYYILIHWWLFLGFNVYDMFHRSWWWAHYRERLHLHTRKAQAGTAMGGEKLWALFLLYAWQCQACRVFSNIDVNFCSFGGGACLGHRPLYLGDWSRFGLFLWSPLGIVAIKKVKLFRIEWGDFTFALLLLVH